MQKSLPNNDVYDIVCLNQQYRCKKANIQNMLYGKTCWSHPHVPVPSQHLDFQFHWSNTTSATNKRGTTNPSGAPEFTTGF
jgi:hypothetical protein